MLHANVHLYLLIVNVPLVWQVTMLLEANAFVSFSFPSLTSIYLSLAVSPFAFLFLTPLTLYCFFTLPLFDFLGLSTFPFPSFLLFKPPFLIQLKDANLNLWDALANQDIQGKNAYRTTEPPACPFPPFPLCQPSLLQSFSSKTLPSPPTPSAFWWSPLLGKEGTLNTSL